MKMRFRILLAALLAVVLGGLAWKMLLSREPVYQGRSLNSWLHDLDSSIQERLPVEQVRVLMAEKQKKLEDAKKQLEDLQEQARKAGVPASMRE